MSNTETISSAVIMLFSIALLVWIIPENTPPYQGYGVSPALIPNVAAGIMLTLSFWGLLRAIMASKAGKQTENNASPAVFISRLLHVAKFLTPSFLLFPAMEQVGFFPAGIAFMVLIQFICGQRKWLANILVSVLVVAGLYAAMRYGFSIALP